MIYKTTLTTEDLTRCQLFAEAQWETSKSHYARRGQKSKERTIEDIITGKLGELAVYRYLIERGYEATEPDFEIYDRKNKSFDADITIKKDDKQLNIHCKAQTTASRNSYGASWLLQYSGAGKGHTDKLFKCRGENDYLAACVVNLENLKASIYTILPIQVLFAADMIELPAVPRLQEYKRAIYYKSLKTLDEKLLQSL